MTEISSSVLSPKGSNSSAQGNALGTRRSRHSKALKGRNSGSEDSESAARETPDRDMNQRPRKSPRCRFASCTPTKSDAKQLGKKSSSFEEELVSDCRSEFSRADLQICTRQGAPEVLSEHNLADMLDKVLSHTLTGRPAGSQLQARRSWSYQY